jgi:hypothetical protein
MGLFLHQRFHVARYAGLICENSFLVRFLSALHGCTAVQRDQIAISKVTEIALSTLGITLDGSKTSPAPRLIQIHMEGADDMNAKEDGKDYRLS